jgi:hypothetical protein
VNDIAEIAKLSLLLEARLQERGLMNKSGNLAETLPSDILDKIDGLVDNVTELEGLLRIGYAVRQGETLSPPVASAARLMIQEVCEAVFAHDELQAVRQTH